MHLSVEIDRKSGFCGGVIRAISKAEDFLEDNPGVQLYSLGSIVHNEAELERLRRKGLVTVGHEELSSLKGRTVLIRAHGEPPHTYAETSANDITVIDCTCPVVLKLQEHIREAYARMAAIGGQIIIFGKVGHAEVLGLVGQTGGNALVLQNLEMLEKALSEGQINTDGPIEIFSQTTKSPDEYKELCKILGSRMTGPLKIHNTICRQVASRHEELANFARTHDIIIFVSGKESSNGKVLYDLCRQANSRTYRIGNESEIDASWFRDGDSVGICGATSTPKWLLESVASSILAL